MRHGERVDEHPAFAKEFYSAVRANGGIGLHDPPLTPDGWLQASEAGKRLKKGGVNCKVIFASPFIRTIETAIEISKVLEKPIVIHYGLSMCAAYIKENGIDDDTFVDSKVLQEKYPGSNIHHDATNGGRYWREIALESFEQTVHELVGEHIAGSDVVVVTHREGIRDITGNCCDQHIVKTPYCTIVKLRPVAHGTYTVEDRDLHRETTS